MILNAIEVNTSEEKTTTHPFFISLPTFIFLRKCHTGSLTALFTVNISTAESFAWEPSAPSNPGVSVCGAYSSINNHLDVHLYLTKNIVHAS